MQIILIVILIICSAYFSSNGDRAAQAPAQTRYASNTWLIPETAPRERTLNILEKYDKALTTILIGNNIVNIACSSIATILAISLVGEKYGSLVSTIVTTVIVLIFGEVMPKSIAKDYPETIAMLASGVISFLMVIFTPFSALFILLKKGVSELMHSSDKVSMTEEELKVMIHDSGRRSA